jgi:hypothetical protein
LGPTPGLSNNAAWRPASDGKRAGIFDSQHMAFLTGGAGFTTTLAATGFGLQDGTDKPIPKIIKRSVTLYICLVFIFNSLFHNKVPRQKTNRQTSASQWIGFVNADMGSYDSQLHTLCLDKRRPLEACV